MEVLKYLKMTWNRIIDVLKSNNKVLKSNYECFKIAQEVLYDLQISCIRSMEVLKYFKSSLNPHLIKYTYPCFLSKDSSFFLIDRHISVVVSRFLSARQKSFTKEYHRAKTNTEYIQIDRFCISKNGYYSVWFRFWDALMVFNI